MALPHDCCGMMQIPSMTTDNEDVQSEFINAFACDGQYPLSDALSYHTLSYHVRRHQGRYLIQWPVPFAVCPWLPCPQLPCPWLPCPSLPCLPPTRAPPYPVASILCLLPGLSFRYITPVWEHSGWNRILAQ